MKMKVLAGLAMELLVVCSSAAGSQPLPDDLQLVPAYALPARAAWFSFQRWGRYPPSPVNWCAGRTNVLYYHSPSYRSTNNIIIDDTFVDYSQSQSFSARTTTENEDTPGPPYGSNDLYLDIQLDTNQTSYVDLILHGATNGSWQLLSKTVLTDTRPWSFGEILYDDGTTNELFYTPLPDDAPPIRFFRAVGGDTVVSIARSRELSTPMEPCSPTDTGQIGIFEVDVNPPVPRALTVVYSISVSASNGVDYTNITGTLVIPTNASFADIYIQPLYDTLLEFEESVTLTLVLTNGYLVDPVNFSATEWISDCSSNLFSVVATNVPSPIGIDYFSPSNSLVLSCNFDFGGEPKNFLLLNTNHVFTSWSGVHGVPDEVKIATVKRTINGFTNADMYFGSGTNIGWLSADGTRSNLTFCILTNAVVTNAQTLRGSLYVDQTGTWSNDLITVTSDSVETSDLKGVWRVDSQGHPTLVATLLTGHLEGVISLTNDLVKWGPWAGKIITGNESKSEIYAIDTNGIATTFNLGIKTEDFDIIPPNQDLYCVLFNDFGTSQSSIVKLSHSVLTNYVGSLLITQAGEELGFPPRLFVVTWTGTGFDVRAITYHPTTAFGHFEHVTFAPFDIPLL